MPITAQSQFRELHDKLVSEGRIQNTPPRIPSTFPCYDCGAETELFVDSEGVRRFKTHNGYDRVGKCYGSRRATLQDEDLKRREAQGNEQ